ncbi:hypothetical protein MJO29_002374 [Puccinia striiformis f. sp. tritici]|nr:hypothetical protein MJO29_002374 [Puccinia striiformis f. sp. tritici]
MNFPSAMGIPSKALKLLVFLAVMCCLQAMKLPGGFDPAPLTGFRSRVPQAQPYREGELALNKEDQTIQRQRIASTSQLENASGHVGANSFNGPVKFHEGGQLSGDKISDTYQEIQQRQRVRNSQARSIGQSYATTVARMPDNLVKNRVTLVNPIQNDDLNVPMVGDDYINASWISEPAIGLPPDLIAQIPGHQLPQAKAWIAAQGPLEETRYDFLSIFLHPDPSQRPQTMIQLTPWKELGRPKCAPYIPDKVGDTKFFESNERFHVGGSSSSAPEMESFPTSSEPTQDLFHRRLEVTLEKSQPGPAHQSPGVSSPTSFYQKNTLVLRLFSGKEGDKSPLAESRVSHYQYLDWPDHGTPTSVEPTSMQHLLPNQLDGKLPALSAELHTDLVASTVDFLREQRVSMVQTEDQFRFVHKAVATLQSRIQ